MAQKKTPDITGRMNVDFGIREKYKPSEDERKMLQYIYMERYQAMKGSKERVEAEKVWEKNIKQWEAYRDPKGPDDWQSNHYVPLTTSVVETALAEVIDESPQPLIIPRSDEDSPKATVMQHIFEYTWDTANGDSNLYDVIKDTFIQGTGIAQEYYLRDQRTIQTGDGTKTQYAYDDVFMESVKLEDFFIDENARDFVGPYAAKDCIRRYIMDIDDFKAFFKGPVWDPLNNAQYVIPSGNTNYYEWYKPPQGIDQSRKVEVLWYWATRPKDWLCVLANDVMIVMGPNPYKHKELPFARAIDVKRPHKFYGKGEPELLESIQDELNTIRRMMIDRNHLDIDKMFFVSSRLNLADEDTIARPHGTIPVDDVNSAKPVEYGDVPNSVNLSKGWLEDDAVITTGINPRASALPQAGTATEAAILKESTLKRIRLKVKIFENEFFTRIGQLRVSNILQYYPQTKMEKIVGEEGTADYQKQTDDLISKGFLVTPGNNDLSKKYQKIPINGKSLNFDINGNVNETSATGTTFFEIRPEYYTPLSQGGFVIKFKSGSTLPVSKPLMQSKAAEMYDRLIQLATAGIGYDPTKLGDLLLTVNDYNPNDYHIDQQGTNGHVDQMAQALINLANQENKIMWNTKGPVPQAPNGTPYASPAHTGIHVQFTSSPSFQSLDKNNPIVKAFVDHIVGELASQQQRAGLGNPPPPPTPPGPQTPPPTGNVQNNKPIGPRPQTMQTNQQPTMALGGSPQMTNTLPAMIQGGAQRVMA